jgi:hypothetical protein
MSRALSLLERLRVTWATPAGRSVVLTTEGVDGVAAVDHVRPPSSDLHELGFFETPPPPPPLLVLVPPALVVDIALVASALGKTLRGVAMCRAMLYSRVDMMALVHSIDARTGRADAVGRSRLRAQGSRSSTFQRVIVKEFKNWDFDFVGN